MTPSISDATDGSLGSSDGSTQSEDGGHSNGGGTGGGVVGVAARQPLPLWEVTRQMRLSIETQNRKIGHRLQVSTRANNTRTA